MKTINNFFVKIGYGIGIFWIFVFIIIYFIASYIGFLLLFSYFVCLPFNWPEVETVKDLSDILKQYAMGISILLITGPKWWKNEETKEPITMWENIGLQISKAEKELNKWYHSRIQK